MKCVCVCVNVSSENVSVLCAGVYARVRALLSCQTRQDFAPHKYFNYCKTCIFTASRKRLWRTKPLDIREVLPVAATLAMMFNPFTAMMSFKNDH